MYAAQWEACMQALAAATQAEVNDMWAGLGYYRRARYLLEGAQYVQNKLAGQMPLATAELQKIPGGTAAPDVCMQMFSHHSSCVLPASLAAFMCVQYVALHHKHTSY